MQIIFKIAEICSKLPFSKIYLPTPDFWMLILYYFVIVGMVILFQKKKMRFLRFILSDEMQRSFQKHWKKIVTLAILSVLLLNGIKMIPRDLKVYFVDVGQR